ncbi:hypothetical protein ACW180_00820 [Limosilactobacillus fermentum]
MKIETLPAEFEPAAPILSRIEEAGFEAYFVGGCVRDQILNLPIHHIDIATLGLPGGDRTDLFADGRRMNTGR